MKAHFYYVLLLAVAGILAPICVNATMYTCTDSTGAVEFTDNPTLKKNCRALTNSWPKGTRPSDVKPNPPAKTQPNIKRHFTGTAFAIGENLLLTNNHVIQRCSNIKIDAPQANAVVIAHDEDKDLALLKTTARFSTYASFRRNGPVTGEDLMLAGYPLVGILGQGISVTKGIVSSAILHPEYSWRFSHTAPTQPGNSGGPIFDSEGNVVGMVVATLNDLAVARETGSIPQNVNFGINSKDILMFIKAAGKDVVLCETGQMLSGSQLAMRAAKFTVLVHCFE